MSDENKKTNADGGNNSNHHIGDRKVKGLAMEIPPKKPSVQPSQDNNSNNNNGNNEK